MYVPGEQIYQLGFDEEYFVEGQRFVWNVERKNHPPRNTYNFLV